MANLVSNIDGVLEVWDDGTVNIVGGKLQIDSTDVLNNNNDAVFADVRVDTLDFGDASPTLSDNGVFLRIQNSNGYTDIGANNASYSHFNTDRASFYFNKKLVVDTGVVQSYDEDLNLNRASSATARLRITSGTTYSDQDFSVTGDVNISGDLTVSGDTVTLNTTTITAEDAVILLNSGQSTPANDIGLIFQRYATSTNSNYNAAIIWEESADKFIFGSTAESGTDTDITMAEDWMVINSSGRVGINVATPSEGQYGSVAPKLHVLGQNTNNAFNLVARFQGGPDLNTSGAAILINHNNDRGLLIEAGRGGSGTAADDDAVSYLGLVESGGTNTRLITLKQHTYAGTDNKYSVGIGTTEPEAKLDLYTNGIGAASTVVPNWSSTTSTEATQATGTYRDMIITNRHGASKHDVYGYATTTLEFRGTNSIHEWELGKIMGVVDPHDSTGNLGGLVFFASDGGQVDGSGRINRGTAARPYMSIGNDIIYANANVGIGITDPTQALEVLGNISVGNYDTTDTGSLLLTGTTASKQAILKCTNGNLHMDSNAGNNIYLNYYSGSGTHFGSGSSTTVAVMGPDGDLWKGSADNTGNKYWHAGNDGPSSGLDADTVDGLEASQFLRSDANDSHTGSLTLDIVIIGNEIRIPNNTSVTDVSLTGTSDEDTGFNWSGSNAVNYISGGVLKYNLNNVWHSGNDGPSSGLDADTLDGQHGSYYQKKTVIQDAPPSGAAGDLWYESDTGILFVYYGGAWIDSAPGIQTSDNLQIASLGVGQAASGTSGEIVCSSVGIGTNSPSAKLHILDGNNIALMGDLNGNSTMSLRMSDSTASPVEVQAYSSSLKLRTTPSGGSMTDRVIITSDGNVGIGITNPSAMLEFGANVTDNRYDIKAPADNARGIGLGNYTTFSTRYSNWDTLIGTNIRSKIGTSQTGEETASSYTASGGATLRIGFQDLEFKNYSPAELNGLSSGSNVNSLGTTRFTIDSSGDVGIGTAPYANSKVTIGGTDAQGYSSVLMFDNNSASGAEFFMLASDTAWTAGANKFIMGHGAPSSANVDMTIDSSGQVGIGTYNPATKLHVAGNIYATGDVTAYYSDIRLKDVEGNIESALDKVNTLNGFYYTGNDTAKSLGYEKLDREVGVSAQQIEEVLPEAVANIPGNDEYKTVKYERLVPLLIESIKELDKKYQDKIDGLMKEIQALKDKG